MVVLAIGDVLNICGQHDRLMNWLMDSVSHPLTTFWLGDKVDSVSRDRPLAVSD